MVVGVGIDLCVIARLRRAMQGPAGARFRARLFTDAEQRYCDARGRARMASYAARFAAKEAVAKALATGIADGIAWRDIEILRGDDEPPTVVLSGGAADTARRRRIARWHLSLTHTGGMAMAVAVGERGGVTRRRSRAASAGEARASRRRPTDRR